MIVIQSDKKYSLYVRTNRRTKWKYAEYGGMHQTVDDAIASAKKHFGDQGFEYLIENIDTGEEVTGFVNWEV